MTRSLDLEFIEEQIDLPFPATAKIMVSNYTSKIDSKGNKTCYVSHICNSFEELESEVARIKAELDDLLREAKSKFA